MAEDKKKTRTTVEIYGHPYTISGTETSTHIRLVAHKVDEKMREIQMHNRFLDTKQIAVLAAVNTMNEYLKIKEELKKLQQHLRNEED
ncbi:cell division protein ZapA [Fictibacillus aquaticus]|uniref:Cell division protein ZapA n=1 Tax=Fictibacillus aquaticus TaxID=2021314 RepID=A0A235FA18_9BACL|nr:cell division protein ZapA [Fictibacillus aquaticus]OYD58138.1 cell division protein ZapA [Fictibacillus aquaticus]